jgi:hypothetical protein
MKVEHIDMPTMTRTLQVVPSSLNEEAGTVEVVASAGATVRRYGFFGEFDEELVVDERVFDLTELNRGAPVLDTPSWMGGTRAIRGVTVEGSAHIAGREVRETLRVDRGNAEGVELWRQISQGFVRKVSIGYDAEYERIRAKDRTDGGSVDLLRSTSVKPLETSFVPIGADPDAGVRSAKTGATRSYAVRSREEIPMSTTAAPAPTVEPVDPAAITRAATIAANKRASEIRAAGLRMLVEPKDIEEIINNVDLDLTAAKARMVDIKAAVRDAEPTRPTMLDMGRSAEEKHSEAIGLALLERATRRADPSKVESFNKLMRAQGRESEVIKPVTDATVHRLGRMKLIQLAEQYLQSRGMNTDNLGPTEIALRALQYRSAGGALMGTADFPYLFENLANKMLLVGYGEAVSPWRFLSQEIPQPDFKQFKMYRRSQAPSLAKLNEHGEVKRAGYGEFTPLVGQLETAGIQVGMTRQMIVNDDMNAFADNSLGLGDSVRRYEDDEALTLLLSTDNLNDGFPPFHSTRGNLSTDVGTPDLNAVIEVARLFSAMTDTVKSATANSGTATIKTPLQLTGFYAAFAEKLLLDQICNLPFVAATAGTTRPGEVSSKPIYEDARLTIESNPNIWFGISQRKALAHGGLEGDPSPRLRTMAATGTDGVVLELIHDFYVAWKDPKALVKVPRT